MIFDVRATGRTAAEVCAELGKKGIRCGPTEKYSVRMVTHYDVDRAGIEDEPWGAVAERGGAPGCAVPEGRCSINRIGSQGPPVLNQVAPK